MKNFNNIILIAKNLQLEPIPKRIKPIDSRMVYDWKNAVPQEGAHQVGKVSDMGWSKERLELSLNFFMFVLLT